MNDTKQDNSVYEVKLFPYKDFFPKIDGSVFLASGVKVIGNVEIGELSSIWYNTVIRGDVNFVKIGKMTNIQDCSILHVTSHKYPLQIGDKVTIGHGVTLHGCTVNNLCLIGMGSILLDGVKIEERSLVAAGSVVTPGFIVHAGKLVAGVPAKIIRDLTDNEMLEFENAALRYVDYTKSSLDSLKKYNYQTGW